MYLLFRNSDIIELRFYFILLGTYIYVFDFIYIKNFDLCIIGFLFLYLLRNIFILRKGIGKIRLYLFIL